MLASPANIDSLQTSHDNFATPLRARSPDLAISALNVFEILAHEKKGSLQAEGGRTGRADVGELVRMPEKSLGMRPDVFGETRRVKASEADRKQDTASHR